MRALRVALCAIILVGGAACDSHKPANAPPANVQSTELTPDVSQNLILEWYMKSCSSDVSFGPVDFTTVDNWMAALPRSRYTLIASGRADAALPGITVDEYQFQFNGLPRSVRYTRNGLRGNELRTISGCFYYPKTINILDTTRRGEKDAVVIFSYDGYALTPLATDVLQLAPWAQQTVIDHYALWIPPGQHTAVLHRLDATGWAIQAVQ